MTGPGWTLDELVAAVQAVLTDVDVTVPNNRVKAVPDRRAIRWYTTIGLLDRPRLVGRTGRYGRRHLIQLVAIKRLQAAGKSLAEIQAALAGATDAQLRSIAGLSDHQLDQLSERGEPASQPASPPVSHPASQRAGERRRFWSRRPATPTPASSAAVTPTPATPPSAPTLRYAIDLAPGITLLLDPALLDPAQLDPAQLDSAPGVRLDTVDLAAVRTAAQPLLDTLARLARAVPEGDAR